MYRIPVEYTDYNGNARKEDFYFHFTEAELMEMQLSTVGGFGEYVQNIMSAQDLPALIKVFKKLVIDSYGVKSDDGRRFIKNDSVRNDFLQTEAYSKIFMDLATDNAKAAEFINNVIPANLASQAKAQTAKISAMPTENN